MLRSLKLVGVGPAPEMEMQFAPRLNVLTGDNGLGKSLFLETIWYVLTGNWAGMPAWPRQEATQARIDAHFGKNTSGDQAIFSIERQQWLYPEQRHINRGLIISARVDGSVAIWDPIATGGYLRAQQNGYVLTPQEILDGKQDKSFRGLVDDIVTWQWRPSESPDGVAFRMLSDVLETISPNPDAKEIIRISKPIRLFVHDKREFPTINYGYGDTPLVHASAGMQRIISLAYTIVWAWQEHIAMCQLVRKNPVKNLVFLMDEVENHLHPEWQRRILPALLKVLESLGEGMQVQMHVTTHSPMVLASLEPHWDNKRDELFHFALKEGKVVLESTELGRWGTASRWLQSRTFGLHADRSIEAERAMEDANALMRGDEPKYFKTPEEIDKELERTLWDQDPFWARWATYMGKSKP